MSAGKPGIETRWKNSPFTNWNNFLCLNFDIYKKTICNNYTIAQLFNYLFTKDQFTGI